MIGDVDAICMSERGADGCTHPSRADLIEGWGGDYELLLGDLAKKKIFF